MGPLRTGFRYGIVAVLVALAADLRFLFVSPTGTPNWILTVIEEYRTSLALAAYIFLGILAAMRMRPDRLEPDVPYRSLLLRDGALAATVVAVMVGITLLVLTAFNATVFAGMIRDYAADTAPSIVAYNEKVANRLDDPPPVPGVAEIEQGLQPPTIRDLGRSITNFVVRTLLIGASGAVVGLLRGRNEAGRDSPVSNPSGPKPSDPQ